MTLKQIWEVSPQSLIFIREGDKVVEYKGDNEWGKITVANMKATSYPMYKNVIEVALDEPLTLVETEYQKTRKEVIKKHRELVKAGRYEVAKNIFKLLNKHEVKLGLGDVDWDTEMILEGIGLEGHPSRNGNVSRFYLYE